MKKAIAGTLMLIGVILSAGVIVPSCTHESLTLSQFDTVCFQRDILPVFQNSCAITGCHNGRGEGFALTSYAEISRHVTPGNAAQSRLYQAITSTLIQPMPPGNALAEADRIKIRIWIEQGAKNTVCSPESASNPLTEGESK